MPGQQRDVLIPAADVRLGGTLGVPAAATGVVLFAHGSGSSRFSRRNRAVAAALQEQGLATLLFDLLTDVEADDRALVFDIPFLADRLRQAIQWVAADPEVGALPVGLFGASTGAAAALTAAADLGDGVRAVVSRGGRPDLVLDRLADVTAPTLLIVGGEDHSVVELNRAAWARLRSPRELVIVPGATHLFEEPGALEQVAAHAARWFTRYLRPV